jgi:hypothetical protein
MNKIILSLFDFSGRWSDPYRNAGYTVHQIDIKHGKDILEYDYSIPEVYGILAAPPCTDFALSGSRFFKQKDSDGRTAKSVELVYKMIEIIEYHNPHFWVVENPMSRIHKLVPELGNIKYKFHPYHHGDPYQKMTWLYGKFNEPERNEVEPTEGRIIYKVGGKQGEKGKEFRSMTPPGFAQAFFQANP